MELGLYSAIYRYIYALSCQGNLYRILLNRNYWILAHKKYQVKLWLKIWILHPAEEHRHLYGASCYILIFSTLYWFLLFVLMVINVNLFIDYNSCIVLFTSFFIVFWLLFSFFFTLFSWLFCLFIIVFYLLFSLFFLVFYLLFLYSLSYYLFYY